ncbi:MAG TPA: CHAD domain-containing protein, partial [Terriglobales bacterium]
MAAKNPDQQKLGLGHWMSCVLEECERADNGLDPEPVHDLRVALRRCRAMAEGLRALDADPSWKQMRKAGKALFSCLGDLRDVQVMEEWGRKLGAPEDPVTQALLRSLAERESVLRAEAAKALQQFDRKQWKKWARALPRRASRFRPGTLVFQHLALERWHEAHELHRRALRDRSPASFHRLRIGLKHLRYIVENFLPQQHQDWGDDLKQLQDLLGEIHDLDVAWQTALQMNAFPDS